MRRTSRQACTATVALLAAFAPGDVAGQDDVAGPWFPDHAWFAPLLADPQQPRYAAALIATNLFDATDAPRERPPFTLAGVSDDPGFDVQGAVAVGIERPIYRLATWDGGGLDVGATVAYFSRFRLEEPSRDEVAGDWWVGVPFFFRDGGLSGRFRIVHRSSHMGDELQEDGARRIEYSYEGIDALAAYDWEAETGMDEQPDWSARVYGGGALNLHTSSYVYRRFGTEFLPVAFDDRLAAQAGAEAAWYPWADAGLVIGLDWYLAQRTDWDSQLAAAFGLTGAIRRHAARLIARCALGPSALGEFFLTDEQVCGLEAWVDL